MNIVSVITVILASAAGGYLSERVVGNGGDLFLGGGNWPAVYGSGLLVPPQATVYARCITLSTLSFAHCPQRDVPKRAHHHLR